MYVCIGERTRMTRALFRCASLTATDPWLSSARLIALHHLHARLLLQEATTTARRFHSGKGGPPRITATALITAKAKAQGGFSRDVCSQTTMSPLWLLRCCGCRSVEDSLQSVGHALLAIHLETQSNTREHVLNPGMLQKQAKIAPNAGIRTASSSASSFNATGVNLIHFPRVVAMATSQ